MAPGLHPAVVGNIMPCHVHKRMRAHAEAGEDVIARTTAAVTIPKDFLQACSVERVGDLVQTIFG